MKDLNTTHRLAGEISQIYQADISQAEALIEAHLRKELGHLTPDKQLAYLEKLKNEFKTDPVERSGNMEMNDDVLSRVSSLLLGRDVSRAGLSSSEVLERLAEALNTIFNTLNQLISVINMTLFGKSNGDETIRYVIGANLEGESRTRSLESYLGQIQQAFLTTQQAFKNAAHARVKEILDELDPEKTAASGGGKLKFGPLRKAECFDIYESKFRSCKKWFESGRFMEAFLREFEKNCRRLSE